MKVRRVSISNFRGVRSGSVLLDTRSLLVGGNAVGKSTVCEALDLVLGLERLYRRPVIDEYDFHQALYRGGEPGSADSPPEVRIEVVLTDLSAEAQRRFAGHVRPWSAELDDFAPPADIAGAGSGVTAAAGAPGNEDADLAVGEWCLPVVFLGRFNPDEDDFGGARSSHTRSGPRVTMTPRSSAASWRRSAGMTRGTAGTCTCGRTGPGAGR